MNNNLKEDHEIQVRVAWYYYKVGMTQEGISKKLGLNRAQVIKILDKARREGVVSFHINSPYTNCLELEENIKAAFNLKDSVIIPEVDQQDINRNLGAAGAQFIATKLDGVNPLLALGWGSTVSHVLDHLSYKSLGQLSLVTLTGGITAYIHNTFGEETNPLYRLSNRFHIIPAPLLVTSADTCRSILDEPEVSRIMHMAELANMTIIGIGSMMGGATFVRHGYVTPQDFEIIRKQGAVGDILAQFYDRDGQLLDVDYHQRLVATPLEKLKKMSHVVALAGGDQKVDAIRGALNGGFFHSLITDERTALKLING